MSEPADGPGRAADAAPAMPSPPEEPADPGVLAGLDPDRWAELLRALRAVLRRAESLDAQLTGFLRDPTSRLAAGRGRAAVEGRLATDAALWDAVLAEADGELGHPPGVDADHADAQPRSAGGATAPPSPPPANALARARARARDLRRERDEWRRRAEGAVARAESLALELDRSEAGRRALQNELSALQAGLAEADAERDRAVLREQRRGQAERDRLTDELAVARRALDEERSRARRPPAPPPVGRAPAGDPPAGARGGFRAGRPSRLPADVVPGTSEAAALLLAPGRLVLVDGYNVTKQHQASLDLELQRRWLLQLLVGLAAGRRVRPVVVFDGARAGLARGPGHRDVEVRFTAAGTTADDELVFAVDATDEPVTVVTDDRELRDRVRRLGADVVDTVSFVAVARGGS